MEIVVTSYKYCRKSSCEVAVGSLRICFEHLTNLRYLVVERFLFGYTIFSVVLSDLDRFWAVDVLAEVNKLLNGTKPL